MAVRGSALYKNHNPTLHFTSVISPYFFVVSWCTSVVRLQILPLIDNQHLASIHRFQLYSWYSWCEQKFYSWH